MLAISDGQPGTMIAWLVLLYSHVICFHHIIPGPIWFPYCDFLSFPLSESCFYTAQGTIWRFLIWPPDIVSIVDGRYPFISRWQRTRGRRNCVQSIAVFVAPCYRYTGGIVLVDWGNQEYTFRDDVIKRKHFPRYWPFVRGIHRYPQKPETRSFDVFFDLRLKNGWVNNRNAGDLRRHCAHFDVTVMYEVDCSIMPFVAGSYLPDVK